ncbi:MAG: hypothetical protein O7G86_03750, partial [Gammaproteobacteria bacterium]|nr:hypothetical protein [Gammaproteobacteria bacterium]
MRSLLVFLLINGLGIAAPALANPCQSVSSYDVDRLRTAAIETDLDKFDTALGPFTVRDLRIVRQDVFPQEHQWLARQTNRFHLLTREWVLEAALPFKVGEVVSEPILAEAERVLRDKPYLYDARVFVRRICDGQADVDVVVRDVWTLSPTLDFNRMGGDNDFGLGVGDVNILGLGKSVDIGYQDKDGRKGMNLYLNDPNIRGSRWTARVVLAYNDDGHLYGVNVSLPYHAMDSRFATGFQASDFVREEGLYLINDKIWEIDARTETMQMFVG